MAGRLHRLERGDDAPPGFGGRAVDIDGPYKLEKASAKVKGATEAQFLFAHRKATPKSDGAAKWLSSVKACGKADWKAGESVDIDASGCPRLGAWPKAQCAGEHDLVKVEGDHLYFGARPADGNLCSKEKRPQALGSNGEEELRAAERAGVGEVHPCRPAFRRHVGASARGASDSTRPSAAVVR